MTLGMLKEMLPITDAYELKSGHTYILRIPRDTPLAQMAPMIQQMNSKLQAEGIKVVLLDDSIPLVEQQ